ncbi:hypothetical protein ABV409_15080 [Flagellimonas sp. DF-77]|uniref:Crp/Fnr family transcriptional regulator n=1 Tax=Flagellimonas algarum TaxID=3230298 RepID=UPI003394375A
MHAEVSLYHQLKSKVLKASKPNPGLWIEVSQCKQELHIAKGELLIDHLYTNDSMFVVVKGAFECIITSNTGKNKPIWFYFDRGFDVIVGLGNQLVQTNTKYHVIAIEPSIVFKFEFWKMQGSKPRYPALREFNQKQLIHWLHDYFEIRNHLHALPPVEFLGYLESHYPELQHRISSQKLARFMGITPEWLSKLKKKRSQ